MLNKFIAEAEDKIAVAVCNEVPVVVLDVAVARGLVEAAQLLVEIYRQTHEEAGADIESMVAGVLDPL